jgi:zinc protease
MKHLLVVASITFLCLVKPVAAVEVQEVVSPGGVIAWLIEEHSIPLISLEYEFSGGSSADPRNLKGLAYLTSGLLNEGAGDLDARAFLKRLDELAIRMSFDASSDQFSGSLQTLTDNAEEAFELLGMALADPSFDQDAVDRVKQQVLAIQRSESQQPRSIAIKSWMAGSFGDHPYGQASKGDEESIAGITTDDLRAYTARHFALDNVIIGVVGDIDAETLGELLDLAFAELPEEADVAPIAAITPSRNHDVQIIDQDVPQSTVIFGSNGLKRNDPDWYTAVLMNYVLGSGGFSSRLFEEVRRKRGLA